MLYGVLLGFLLLYMLATFTLIYILLTGRLTTRWETRATHVDEGVEDTYDSEVDAHLTPLEKERIADQKAFDARIDKIKQELSQTASRVGRTSAVVAEEYPGIRNLPHSAVRVQEPLEIAD